MTVIGKKNDASNEVDVLAFISLRDVHDLIYWNMDTRSIVTVPRVVFDSH